jgi:hypothetical protein
VIENSFSQKNRIFSQKTWIFPNFFFFVKNRDFSHKIGFFPISRVIRVIPKKVDFFSKNQIFSQKKLIFPKKSNFSTIGKNRNFSIEYAFPHGWSIINFQIQGSRKMNLFVRTSSLVVQ